MPAAYFCEVVDEGSAGGAWPYVLIIEPLKSYFVQLDRLEKFPRLFEAAQHHVRLRSEAAGEHVEVRPRQCQVTPAEQPLSDPRFRDPGGKHMPASPTDLVVS